MVAYTGDDSAAANNCTILDIALEKHDSPLADAHLPPSQQFSLLLTAASLALPTIPELVFRSMAFSVTAWVANMADYYVTDDDSDPSNLPHTIIRQNGATKITAVEVVAPAPLSRVTPHGAGLTSTTTTNSPTTYPTLRPLGPPLCNITDYEIHTTKNGKTYQIGCWTGAKHWGIMHSVGPLTRPLDQRTHAWLLIFMSTWSLTGTTVIFMTYVSWFHLAVTISI